MTGAHSCIHEEEYRSRDVTSINHIFLSELSLNQHPDFTPGEHHSGTTSSFSVKQQNTMQGLAIVVRRDLLELPRGQSINLCSLEH